ncbi:MAG: hypothetical protein Q7R91_01080 [bacterium]|nr:hypothetical protein [bacterium]
MRSFNENDAYDDVGKDNNSNNKEHPAPNRLSGALHTPEDKLDKELDNSRRQWHNQKKRQEPTEEPWHASRLS